MDEVSLTPTLSECSNRKVHRRKCNNVQCTIFMSVHASFSNNFKIAKVGVFKSREVGWFHALRLTMEHSIEPVMVVDIACNGVVMSSSSEGK